MDTRWRIELLGGLRARKPGAAGREDQVVPRFRTQKTALLLAYLAYYRQRAHPREALIELLWPACDPDAGRDSLNTAVSALRRQLRVESPGTREAGGWRAESADGPEWSERSTLDPPAAPVPEPSTLILSDRTTLRLNPDAAITDVALFRAALRAAARAEAGPERTPLLVRAVECYRGALLPGHHDGWILQERQWLAERYFEALTQLLTHLQQEGDIARALGYAQRGVRADPLREEAHRDLMRLYAAAGQFSAAQHQYQELERLLKEEMNTTPEPATRALAREIERLAVLRRSGVPAFGRSGVQDRADLADPSEPERLNAQDHHCAAPGTGPGPAARVPPSRPPSPERLNPEGENRLVTVLFADMSDSLRTTAHLAPDEAAELVNQLLKRMVDVLLTYEGSVDRFLGDGVLAIFGTPQARESDPERAVRAALEIREAARELGLEVTAGINTGEVYIGEVGSDRHREVTVMGPVVNLASRLQGQAEPGQILVGETTYRHTRRAFTFTPLSLTVKGLAHPVPAYAVGQPLPRPEKARGIEGLSTELIGRGDELARLQSALQELRRGRGQMVSLVGEAGVGKSRLVAELKQVVGSRAWGVGSDGSDPTPDTPHPTPLWLEGRCLEMSAGASYSVVVDLFRDYFGWRPEEGEFGRARRLVADLRQFVEEGELSREREEEMAPLLGRLLFLRVGTSWEERLKQAGPEQIKQQTFLAIRDFFVAVARRQPVVLVLEDLHWADSLSLDVLSMLMEAVAQAPLLLLCVYRPEQEHRCWHLASLAERKCPEQLTRISLRELTPPESRRLVEALLPGTRAASGDDLPDPVPELILARCHGNPFFIEEVVRSLLDAGILYREENHWRCRERPERLALPEGIQSVILSRVDPLSPELKRTLQTAAVMGRLFWPRLLAVVGVQAFEHSGVQAFRRSGVQGTGAAKGVPAQRVLGRSPGPRSGGPGPARNEQEHEHEQEHEQEQGQDLNAERLNARTSERLDACLWELEERGLIYPERVVPEAEYSFRHVLTQEAIYRSLTQRQRALLHRQVAEAMEALYGENLDERCEALAYHYERGGADEEAQARASGYLLRAAERARRAAAHREEAMLLARAIRMAERRGEHERVAELQAQRGRAFVSGAMWQEARPEIEAALTGLGQESREQRAELLSHLSLASYWLLDVPHARQCAAEALSLAEAEHRDDLVARAMGILALARSSDGELRASLDEFRHAFARAGKSRVPLLEPAIEHSGLLLYWLGRLGESIERNRQAIAAAQAAHDSSTTIRALSNLGTALSANGRYEEARRTFAEAQAFGRERLLHHEYGMGMWLARATSMEAGFHLDIFDFAGAQALAEEAREMGLSVGFPVACMNAGVDLLLSLARRQDVGRAEALVDEVAAHVRAAAGVHAWTGRLRFAQARAEIALARGHPEGARSWAQDVIAQSRRLSRVKYEVAGLETRGKALAALGRQREAVADLQAAVALARPAGDPAMFLRAAGALLAIEGTDALATEARAAARGVRAALPDEGLRRSFEAAEPLRVIGPLPRPSSPGG